MKIDLLNQREQAVYKKGFDAGKEAQAKEIIEWFNQHCWNPNKEEYELTYETLQDALKKFLKEDKLGGGGRR